ncbi:DUF397 domain-containing protein [Nocardia sp. NBC_00511]|uniref:DUF397 domain-containing protein n=1 Tax=Nocardia sp. NBC_00511 TaxID=2903591 RepID=UPI0030E27E80
MYNLSGTDPRLAAAKFFKSPRSGGKADCVEVAWLSDGAVAVRHSQAPDGHVLIFSPGEWDAFEGGVQDGAFKRPTA